MAAKNDKSVSRVQKKELEFAENRENTGLWRRRRFKSFGKRLITLGGNFRMTV